eukprot:TRINITY_DN66357_c0_g1_i1.p1 TRINITY_DN66357_c0_g1~~TRINITY_DN66357_c0_g1_i1.p1  ORF type:complete len:196 (+),score=97.36 TRINITY_DN66357_c0_g1_i1:91-678(+)
MVKSNRPVETSARKPVSTFREVVKIPPKRVGLDPRFNELSGSFNQGLFDASYDWLDGMREKEEKQLRGKLRHLRHAKRAAAVERRDEAAAELRTLRMQRSEIRKQKQKRAAKQKWRKEELEAVAQGKKPYFLKRAALKETELREKYADLKARGQVDKFLAKQRRKQALREGAGMAPELSAFRAKHGKKKERGAAQ